MTTARLPPVSPACEPALPPHRFRSSCGLLPPLLASPSDECRRSVATRHLKRRFDLYIGCSAPSTCISTSSTSSCRWRQKMDLPFIPMALPSIIVAPPHCAAHSAHALRDSVPKHRVPASFAVGRRPPPAVAGAGPSSTNHSRTAIAAAARRRRPPPPAVAGVGRSLRHPPPLSSRCLSPCRFFRCSASAETRPRGR